mgnify:CR=1 FL=1|jgi:hypothetical protein|tara:strand:- start:11815 stop:12321 length:507 start_codon:yes stop_codon:yes gene_type:complete
MKISRRQLRKLISESIGDSDGDGTSDREELMTIASNMNMEYSDAPSPNASWKELHAFFNKDYSAKLKKANQKYTSWIEQGRMRDSKDFTDLRELINTNQAQLELESLGRLGNYMNELFPIHRLITHEILRSTEGSAFREAGYAYLRNIIGAADRHASKMRSGAYGKLD